MFLVHIFICVPLSGKEWMFITYYFTIEEGDHLWVFVCEVFNLQVSAEVGVLLIHMLENHLGTTVVLIIVYKEIIIVIFGFYLLLLSAS